MKAATRAFVRLLGVQACWTYERMQGIGIAHASEPLLAPLEAAGAERARAARGRAAEFFNGQPYLAGLAVGAAARAELDGVAPEAILRLRSALTGPLGSLGDRLFWAGTVPLLMTAALAGAALGAGAWPVLAAVALHNGVRAWVGRWALALGLAHGPAVGTALAASWLPRAAVRVVPAAALAAGAAIPLVLAWVLGGVRGAGAAVVGGAVLVGLVAGRRLGPRFAAGPLTAVALLLTLLWCWGFA